MFNTDHKLTMVSVRFNGRLVTRFINLPTSYSMRGSKKDIKTVAPSGLVNRMLAAAGCSYRGQTYSVG